MITRLRYPKGYQFFDANGAPLALGNLYYYVAGTTTPLDTYSDSAGTVPNTNPIVLDGSGRLDVDVYLGSGSNYKEVLTTASATIAPWPDDNIPLASQPDWNATSGPNQILNKPTLAAVAYSGQYSDLAGVPATSSPFTGDSGSGGAAGLVPAPAAGDAVANMFLSANGSWEVPPGSSTTVTLNTSAATASGNVLTFASVPSSIVAGMLVEDGTTSSVIPSGTTVSSTTGTAVTLSAAVTEGGVLSGDAISFYGSGSATTNLSVSETSNSVSIASSSGSGVTIPAATDTVAGVLDAARAAKIDGLATVATSGSYADLANQPANMTGATSSAPGYAGFVPAPAAGQQTDFLRGDGTWAAVGEGGGSSSPMTGATSGAAGTGGTVPPPAAGQQGYFLRGDATWDQITAGQVGGLATVATSGSYTDLSNQPSIPSLPSALSGLNIDNIARLGIGTTDTSNNFSFKGPTALFAGTGDMRVTMSKGASANTAAFNFQDNFSTRAQFGLLGNDNFTVSTSPDGSTFNSAIVASPSGAVSFPNTAGFTGDSGAGGTSGLVPAPAAGTAATGAFLKADGTWSVPAGSSSSPMTGATSSAAGTPGAVPSPSAGQQASFLRGDATWQQMTAAQVSGLAPSATTDTTNASNITSGTLAAAQIGDLSATYLTVTAAASEYAPLNSPALTGTPTAPTQAAGNNSTAIATTAYLDRQLGANNGLATLNASGTLNSSQIPASLVGAVVYQGTWNAATNTPALASGVGTLGDYYKVSVAGTTEIDGNSQWAVGDTIIFDGSTWDKINGAEPEVLSVAGLTGAIAASALSSALALGSLATLSALPAPTSSVLGGVSSAAAPSNQFMTGINSSGAPTFAQPSATNVSGLGSLATLSGINNSNWSGTPLAIANGGTGQTSASAAFNALSPMTAAGDLIYGGTSGAGTRLAAGTSSQVLIGGTTPSWGAVNLASMVTGSLSISNINATGTPSSTTYLRGDGTWSTPTAGTGSPGGSSGQFQYNNSGSFGGLSTFSAVSGLPMIGDGGSTPATNKLLVNNSVSGSNNRQYSLGNGTWWSTAVPFLQPYTDNTGIAFDLMPKGATVSSGGATCWIDICSTDITADSTNWESLNLKKTAAGDCYISGNAAGTGVVRNIRMQTLGGGMIIGYDHAPLSMLDVRGGVAIGSYAGSSAAPSNSLIVSGQVGINTSTPGSGIQLDVGGMISSGYSTNNGEVRAWKIGGSTYISMKGDGTNNRNGLYDSTLGGYMLYSDLAALNVVLNQPYSGQVISFCYKGTEYGRMANGGNWGIGSGYSSSAPTVPLDVNGAIRTRAVATASLPSASSAGAGARHCVTDSTQTLSAGIGTAATGGGSNTVPVFSNGSSWIIG